MRRYLAILIVFAVAIVAIAILLFSYSILGRFVRWFSGEVWAKQTAKMRRYLAILIVFAVAIIAIATLLFSRTHAFRRSVPGRIVRWFSGEAGAKQTANDLAEDIREHSSLSQLQPWSIETLARFRSGQVHTNGEASYWSAGTIRLAVQERPEFITHEWGTTNQLGWEAPEISVLLNSEGQPECMVIAWYLYGIAVGAPDYHLTFKPWYYVEAKPGVYVYYFYK